MVDNDRKVCSLVNALIGGNLFFLELYILRYLATRMPRMARYETHSNRTSTGTQRGNLMTSPVYVHTRTNTVAMEFRGD